MLFATSLDVVYLQRRGCKMRWMTRLAIAIAARPWCSVGETFVLVENDEVGR